MATKGEGFLVKLLPRMIEALGMSFDIGQAEPGGLELLAGVELRLVEVVRRRRVGVFTEHHDRPGLHLWTEFHDADERMAGYTVAALLTFFRARVKVEYDADIAR